MTFSLEKYMVLTLRQRIIQSVAMKPAILVQKDVVNLVNECVFGRGAAGAINEVLTFADILVVSCSDVVCCCTEQAACEGFWFSFWLIGCQLQKELLLKLHQWTNGKMDSKMKLHQFPTF